MKSNGRLEIENTKKIHYLLLGKNWKKTKDKLEKNLHFYTLVFSNKFNGMEIIYDVPTNMLSNAGIVISKQYEGDKIYFKVRKISRLPGGYKRPSQKFTLGESEEGEAPKDFPLQIAHAISDLYANVFTIDLVSIVRQTEPKYEITVSGDSYKIVGGTGYRAELLYEKSVYKEISPNSKKKQVKRVGVTLIMPKDEKYEKENQIITQTIDHYCKELVGNDLTRFEIAQHLLHPETVEIAKTVTEDDEEQQEEQPQNKKKKKGKKS